MTPQAPVYAVLTAAAVGLVAGRLASLSEWAIKDNDRSRWATVRAVVHDGTYAIGHRVRLPDGSYRDEGIVTEQGWGTVDRVLHPDRDVFYSSKPPLLASVVAVVYAAVWDVTGWSIVADRERAVRVVLVFVGVLPLAAYLVVLGRVIDRLGQTSWGRVYVFAAGCFGTFVSTFSVVLNNHTPAVHFTLFAVACGIRAVAPAAGPNAAPAACTGAGFFAGCAAACDLPAMSLVALLGLGLARRCGLRAGAWYAAGLAVPAVAWGVANYAVIGQVRPAYAEVGSPWYLYEGSRWTPGSLTGIERAGAVETRFEYAFHLTFGHHGLFSLTPVFLLSLWFMVARWRAPEDAPVSGEPTRGAGTALFPALAWATFGLLVVTLGFYVLKSSNYGGLNVGPRWLFWLTPLLLLSALPAADALGRTRAGRVIGIVLLAASAFSAAYRATDPWSHPWLYELVVLVDPSSGY